MDQPLIAQQASSRWRLNPFRRAPRPPVDPSPETLAALLHEHGAHRAAAKRLDTFQAAEAQHREERRAKQRLLLGAAGLVLSVTPAVPGAIKDCRADAETWDCGLRVLALTGGALALATTAWSAWELWHHRSRLEAEAERLSQTLARAQQSKAGAVAYDDVFHRFRGYSRAEREKFSLRLHELARQPRSALTAAAHDLSLAV